MKTDRREGAEPSLLRLFMDSDDRVVWVLLLLSAGISVLVLNGNGVSGAAGGLATDLLAVGYGHAVPTDAPNLDYARSLVKWLTSPIGQAVVATTISDAVRVPEISALERRFYEDRFGRAEP